MLIAVMAMFLQQTCGSIARALPAVLAPLIIAELHADAAWVGIYFTTAGVCLRGKPSPSLFIVLLRVVPHDRERIGGRHVPACGEIRGRPLRRNPERDLDLADVGGKAGAATHEVILGHLGNLCKSQREL